MGWRWAVVAAFFLCGIGSAQAEVDEVSIARQPSLGHLPLMIMEEHKLLEKAATERGIPDLKVKYLTLAGGAAMNDALLSGSIQFAAGGVPPLVVLWARTQGSAHEVKAVAAMNAMPLRMVTLKPSLHALKDLGDADKIALPAVKVSVQAIILQMAAEKELGPSHMHDLDKLTVTLSHPDGMAALLSRTEVACHFTAPPIQDLELARPGAHALIDSFDVMGPNTFNVVWSTDAFRTANPKVYAAFVAALSGAIAMINADKAAAAETYIRLSHDAAGPALIKSILDDPRVTFTTTPQAIMTYVAFMHRTGLIKRSAASWKDLFFPNAQTGQGS